MTTAVSASMVTVSTGTSGIGISSTIARFSARAIMPSTVRITGLPGWHASTRASSPSMLASASGSGLTCETTTTRANGARVASSRRSGSAGLVSGSSSWDPCSAARPSSSAGSLAARRGGFAAECARTSSPPRSSESTQCRSRSASLYRVRAGPRASPDASRRSPPAAGRGEAPGPPGPLDRRQLDDPRRSAGAGRHAKATSRADPDDHRPARSAGPSGDAAGRTVVRRGPGVAGPVDLRDQRVAAVEHDQDDQPGASPAWMPTDDPPIFREAERAGHESRQRDRPAGSPPQVIAGNNARTNRAARLRAQDPEDDRRRRRTRRRRCRPTMAAIAST